MPRQGAKPTFIRPGLLPAVLGAIVQLAGLALISTDWYLYVLYASSILALIMVITAIQNRRWYWAVPLLAIAVIWNPAWPLQFQPQTWRIALLLGSAAFIAIGALFRVPDSESGKR